jgi:hypothetical protein
MGSAADCAHLTLVVSQRNGRRTSWGVHPLGDALIKHRLLRNDHSLPLAFKVARLFKLPIEAIFEPDKG